MDPLAAVDRQGELGQLALDQLRPGREGRPPRMPPGGRERRGPLEVGKGCQLNQRSVLACDETDLVEVAVDRGDPLPHHPEQPHLLTRGDELEALDVERKQRHLAGVVLAPPRALGPAQG